MKQQYIDKITKACIKINPEIVEYVEGLFIQRPVQLADVLLASKKHLNQEPEVFFVPYDVIVRDVVVKSRWKLTKPLEEQEEETLKFISELLK